METLFVGRNNIFLTEVDSTNSYAIKLLKNVNIPEGTVVHTHNQTKGKGQRGNEWHSEKGNNITATVLLKPTFLDIKKQFLLYQVAALACYDVMAEILDPGQYDIKIKWPNDIMVNRKKVAGILIENVITNNVIQYSLSGIGININQTDFPEGLNATSVRQLTGKKTETGHVLQLLCRHIEKYYLMLKRGGEEEIINSYHSRFFMKDEWWPFEWSGRTQSFKIIGTGGSGLLLLEDHERRRHEFDVKQVKWII